MSSSSTRNNSKPHSSEESTTSCESLSCQMTDELEVLSKLLYRNQNQHGKTKYYRQIKIFYKIVNQIPLDSMQDAFLCILSSVKCTQGNKYEHDDCRRAFACCRDVCILANQCSSAMVWALKASESLRLQLEIQVFVTLLTSFLASIARIWTLLKFMNKKFLPYRDIICSNLRGIVLVNPAKTEWITEALNDLPIIQDVGCILLNDSASGKFSNLQAEEGSRKHVVEDDDVGEELLVSQLFASDCAKVKVKKQRTSRTDK